MSFHLQPPDALYSFNCCYMDSWRENWLQVQTTFSPLIYSLASPPLQTLLVSSPAPSEHIFSPTKKKFSASLPRSLLSVSDQQFSQNFLSNLDFNNEIYIFSVSPCLESPDCNLQEHKWSAEDRIGEQNVSPHKMRLKIRSTFYITV